jgi:hypothetical protein
LQRAHARFEIASLALSLRQIVQVLNERNRLVVAPGLPGGNEFIDCRPEIVLPAGERFEPPLSRFGFRSLAPGFLPSALLNQPVLFSSLRLV